MNGVFIVGPTIDPLFQTYMTATEKRHERAIDFYRVEVVLTLIVRYQHCECSHE